MSFGEFSYLSLVGMSKGLVMPRQAVDREIAQIASNFGKGDTVVTQFIPNPGGQERLFHSQAHEIIFSGGNDVGKTFSGIMMCAFFIIPEYIDGKPTGFTIHPHRKIRIPKSGMELWISTWSEKTQIDTILPIYNRILLPYETDERSEGGAKKYALFEDKNTGITSRIDFKYQTMGVDSYTGSKKHFIMLDEPHSPAIYNESKKRIGKYEGVILSTLTPVVDEDAPGARMEDILKFKENIIDPWLDNEEDYPLREVIFSALDENKGHINVEFSREMNKGMSDEERSVRETGQFVSYSKRCWFDQQMLRMLKKHLLDNKDQYQPEYGYLEYDAVGRDEYDVVFVRSDVESFPEKPSGQWIVRIWEHPYLHESGFIRPDYHIGVDVAGGKKLGDYTAAYVKRADTGAVVASLHGHLNEIELSRQLNLLGMYYHSHDSRPAYLAIEANPSGGGNVVIGYLVSGNTEHSIQKYDIGRMYHRPSASDMERGIGISSGEPGWYTSNRTRPWLLTAMRQDFVMASELVFKHNKPSPIPDVSIVEEGLRFSRGKDGKYQAMSGFYDDRLIAMSICDLSIDQYGNRTWRDKVLQQPLVSDEEHYYLNKDGELMLNIEGIIREGMKEEIPQELYY